MTGELIAQQKEGLHPSLRTFKSPLYRIKTEQYLIRIDQLADNTYRYASWKSSASESSTPDLIIANGAFEYDGSGGNHQITFSNGGYLYRVYRNVLGTADTPEVTLQVMENGAAILTEDGSLVRD